MADSVVRDAASRGDVDGLEAAVRQWPQLIEAGDPSQYGATPMHAAAMNGHAAVVEVLHRLGAQLDRQNGFAWTPMHVAAMNGHAAVVETLHRLGSAALDSLGEYGATPMHFAAASGHASVVETLRRLGSTALDRPNDSAWTPMHLAAHHGHVQVVATLRRLGSRALDAPDSIAHTPMHAAAWSGHVAVVETLIRLGSTTLEDRGADVLLLALERSSLCVAQLLLVAGVDATPLLDKYPEQLQLLFATAVERRLELRYRLYFASTLLDRLLQ